MKRSFRNQSGASLVEYSLLVALISTIAFPAVGFLGTQSNDTFMSACSGFGSCDGEMSSGSSNNGDDGSGGDGEDCTPYLGAGGNWINPCL